MSFESGLSDDYAIPPDAVSTVENTCMDASMPSLLMRTSYADSPKKMETLEKVGYGGWCQLKQDLSGRRQ